MPVPTSEQRRAAIRKLRQRRAAVNFSLQQANDIHAALTDIGPLTKPAINPFLRQWNKDRTPKEAHLTPRDYKHLATKADTFEKENRRMIQDQSTEINFAIDTHLTDKHLGGRHVDDEIKRIAEIYITRFGFLNNRLIREILKDHTAINQSNFGAHRTFLINYQSKVQNQTLSFLRLNMETLVHYSGGAAAWRQATPRQRKNLIAACFNEFPTVICKLCFHFENNATDFENIWGSQEGVRTKWQRFFRSIFVALAEKVYKHHTRYIGTSKHGKKDVQKLLYYFYKAVKRSEGVASLKLGKVDEVPSRSSRGEDGSRALVMEDVPDIDIFY